MLGKKMSNAAKKTISQKNSISQAGSKNSQYGKPKSEQHLEKLKMTWATKPIIKCPHCDVSSINPTPMKKHHFDNCKNKT